jgi:hypothetical protein
MASGLLYQVTRALGGASENGRAGFKVSRLLTLGQKFGHSLLSAQAISR